MWLLSDIIGMGTEFSFCKVGGTRVLLLSLPPRSMNRGSVRCELLDIGFPAVLVVLRPTDVLLA